MSAGRLAMARVRPEKQNAHPTEPVVGSRAWSDLLGGVFDALSMRPPDYVRSIFGAPWTWLLPADRYSEFGLLDVWRPLRTFRYLTDVLVPSLPRTPPRLIGPVLGRLFAHPTLVLQRGDHNGSYTTFPDEQWFFVNGIMTNDAVAQLNAAYLAYLFHRPITLIQNSTCGLVEDLLECAAGKTKRNTEAATKAFPVLYDALMDDTKSRVVLIAHSQGTIIVGAMLEFIARHCLPATEATRDVAPAGPELVYPDDMELDPKDFPGLTPEKVAKLEVYCFGNCATNMRYVSSNATDSAEPSVPWIESFGNEHDLVARIGMLAPNASQRGVHIDGPRFERTGAWGHLLNEHYLQEVQRAQKKDRKRGPKTNGPEPYALVNETTFPGATPRLYSYINGGA
jgi:hypothetical protein